MSTLRVAAPDSITAIGLAEHVKPLASTLSSGQGEVHVSIETGSAPLNHALRSIESWLEAYHLKSTVIDWGGKSYSLERPVLLPSVGSAADLDALLAV
jgi:hypothetical protein